MDYRPERLHSDLSRFRNGNPFSSLYDFLSDASICHLEKGGMVRVAPKAALNRYPYLFFMYTIFPPIIGGRVAFLDFENGIINLLE